MRLKMNRKIHDPTSVVNSSIVLLQERFRQLQRVKEMREKRELLKMIRSSTSSSETKHFSFNEPITRVFFHPELINMKQSSSASSSSSPPRVSLSLWPTTTSENMVQDDINNNTSTSSSGSDTVETLVLFKNLCSQTQPLQLQPSWNNVYDSGVDTSLHL